MSFFTVFVLFLYGVSVHSGPIDQGYRHSKTASIGDDFEFLLRQIGISDDVQILTKNGTQGCQVNEEFYLEGEDLPTQDPCEYCVCKPPGLACEVIKCDHKPGCRSLERAGLCCPEYICDCEQDGIIYGNTDQVVSKDPCLSCFCVTGSITCSKITCQAPSIAENCDVVQREDECCPSYTNCAEQPLVEAPVIAEEVAEIETVESETLITETPLTDQDESYSLAVQEESDVEQVVAVEATIAPEIIEEPELLTKNVTLAPVAAHVEESVSLDHIEIDLAINEIIPQVGVEQLYVIDVGEETLAFGAESLGVDLAEPIEVEVADEDEVELEVVTVAADSLLQDNAEDVSVATDTPLTDQEYAIVDQSNDIPVPEEETYAVESGANIIVPVETEPLSPAVLSPVNVEESEVNVEETTEASEYNAIILPDEKGHLLESLTLLSPIKEVFSPLLTGIDAEEITIAPAEDSTMQEETHTVVPVGALKNNEALSYEDNDILTKSDNSDVSTDEGEFWMSMLQSEANDGKESLKVNNVRINDKLASIDDDVSDHSYSVETKKHVQESDIVINDPKAEWNVDYALHASASAVSYSSEVKVAPLSSEVRKPEIEATTLMDEVQTETVTEIVPRADEEDAENRVGVEADEVTLKPNEVSSQDEINNVGKTILKLSSVQDDSMSNEFSIEAVTEPEYPATIVRISENEILEKGTRNERESVTEQNAELRQEENTEIYRDMLDNIETESPLLRTDAPIAMSDTAVQSSANKIIDTNEEDMYWLNMLKSNDSAQMNKLKDGDAEEISITTLSPREENTEIPQGAAFRSDINIITERNEVEETTESNLIREESPRIAEFRSDIDEITERSDVETTVSYLIPEEVTQRVRSDLGKYTENAEAVETTLSTLIEEESTRENEFRSDMDDITERSEIAETTDSILARSEDITTESPVFLREEQIDVESQVAEVLPTTLVENTESLSSDAMDEELNLKTSVVADANEEDIQRVETRINLENQRETLANDEADSPTETEPISNLSELLNRKRKLDSQRVTKFSLRRKPTRFDTWKKVSVTPTGRNEFQIIEKDEMSSNESPENLFEDDMEILMNPLDTHFLKIARKYGLRPLTTKRNLNLRQRRKDFRSRGLSSYRRQHVH